MLQRTDITPADPAAIADLKVGQAVWVHSNRWTPTGWEPVKELAEIVDPCVTGDPVYAGDVEVKQEGVLSRVFVAREDVEPVADRFEA